MESQENPAIIGVDLRSSQDYQMLCAEVNRAAKYYVLGEPFMPNAQYDYLKAELARYEAEKPEWIVDWSPVGKPMSGVNDGVVPPHLGNQITPAVTVGD